MAAAQLPFKAESDLLWSIAIAGNMDEKAPSVLDRLSEDNRANFDNNFAKVINFLASTYWLKGKINEDIVLRCIIHNDSFCFKMLCT